MSDLNSGPRRRRLAPTVRRAQIVDVATSMIAERGYHRLTLSELAERAGLTRAGLSHHFPTRGDIFISVLEARDAHDISHLIGKWKEGWPQEVTFTADGCLEVLDELVRWNSRQPEIVRLYTVLSAEALADDHPAHAYFQRRYAQARLAFEQMASPWHPAPGAFAAEVHAYLDGIQLGWLRDPTLDLVALWRAYAATILQVVDEAPRASRSS